MIFKAIDALNDKIGFLYQPFRSQHLKTFYHTQDKRETKEMNDNHF
jgi:hypothetical protein